MLSKTESLSGVANSSIIGNNNVVNANVTFEPPKSRLTHSKVNDLLKIIYDSEGVLSDQYSLKYPICISQKMEYNQAYRYQMHFEECAEIYLKIDYVMKDYLDGEIVEKKLALLYQRQIIIKDGRPVVGNGDEQLERICADVKRLIVNDARFDATQYFEEEIENLTQENMFQHSRSRHFDFA